jgi:hypothetical protein
MSSMMVHPACAFGVCLFTSGPYPARLAGLSAKEEEGDLLLGVRFVLLALLVLVVAAFFVARSSEAQEEQ